MLYLLLALVSSSFAGTPWWGGNLDLNSRYQWRGLHFSDGPVMQGALEGGISNLTVGTFGNLALGFGDDALLFDELDLYTSWTQQEGDIWVSPSLVVYMFPGLAPTTGEVLLDMGWMPATLGLQGGLALDVMDAAGSFWGQMEAVYEPALDGPLALQILLGGGAGNGRFNEYYAGLESGGFSSAWLQFTADHGLSSSLGVSAWVRGEIIVNDALRQALGQPLFNPVGGVSLSF